MATELFSFGIKYRLVVGDVEGTDWKIEIEEKDFSGNATNFIGDGTAFEITWENNEDYDKSIIGSYCKINIMAKPVLDSGTPDFSELFTTDETKYRVKIYYDTNPSEFLANYQLYWQGFIVQDEYVEEVTSDPYRISVLATDNFGKLKSFPFNDNDPTKHELFYTPAQVFYDALTRIGLAIDMYDFSGLYLAEDEFVQQDEPFTNQVAIDSETFLKSDSFKDYVSYFEAIDSITKSMNCFLVQAYGELYLVSKAAYDSVLNNGFDWDGYKLTFGASSFSTSKLISADFPYNVLSINNDLRVLNRSLIKTKKSAAKASINQYNLKSKNLLYNGSFEMDGDFALEVNGAVPAWFTSWRIGSGSGHIGVPASFLSVNTHDYSTETGDRSLRVSIDRESDFDSFNAANETLRNQDFTRLSIGTDFQNDRAGNTVNPYTKGFPFVQNHSSGEDYELQANLFFRVYYSEASSPNEIIPFRIVYSLNWKSTTGKDNQYYDFETGTWSTNHVYGTEEITEAGKWIDVSKNIVVPVVDGANLRESGVVFRIHLAYPDNENTSSFYLDDVSLTLAQPEGSDEAFSAGNNSFVASISEDENNIGSETKNVSLLNGLTNFDWNGFTSTFLFERTDLISGKLNQQYWRLGENNVYNIQWNYDKNPSQASPYSPRPLPLQSLVNEHRWDETKVTQTYLEGVLKNITQTNGSYTPVSMLDILTLSFREGNYDNNQYFLTRMTFNPRNNLINFVARNIVETQGTYSES